jgi:stage II sporulation protein D
MMRRSAVPAALAACLLALLALAPVAPAATSKLVIKGRGYGHGIGMSQYGALGYAQHGFSYRDILDHYYAQTDLLPLGSKPDVRVLLQSGRRVVIAGAVAAADRALNPARTYSASQSAGRIVLKSSSGRRLGTYDAPLRFAAPSDGAVQLRGPAANGTRDGRYRGAIEVRPKPGGVMAVNAVGLEDYVRGVISAESPAGWPAEALKAQAVAARTYAVTTNVGTTTDGIDQYADTRSQMYKGVAAEFPATDAAVAATSGEVVAYQGRPVVTYFFSTSGGHTENVEFSFIGSLPRPWLQGVDDPFDDVSPRHEWKPASLTGGQAAAKLRGLVRGGFRGIKVLQRGASPRIVRAEIVGTNGVTQTTGPELRKRLGLFDTWATFTYISSKAEKPKKDEPTTTDPGTEPAPGDGSGGTTAIAARRAPHVLTGVVDRARRGQTIRIQQRAGAGGWRTVGTAAATARGRYRATLPGSGVFRVAWGDVTGPSVRVP